MAAVAPQSENIEKVKVANQKEDVRLRLRMDEMQKQKRLLLEQLQRDQLKMVHQVKANRIRELRNSLRKGLGMEEQVNMMRQKVFPGSIHAQQKMRPGADVAGFSKVDVEEDDDTEVYMEYLKGKSNPELHVLQAMWAKRREEEDTNSKDKAPQKFDIRDTEVFVRYPTSANAKTRGIISVTDVNRMQKLKMESLQNKNRSKWRPQTEPIGTKRSRYPIPRYVDLMQRQWDTNFDMYTDGTMLLEVRKAKQKQRERTPVPVGYLPVRKRYIDQQEDMYRQMIPKELRNRLASSGPAMSIHGRTPNRVCVYLPKSQEAETKNEEQEEHERLLRLKQADQADQFEETLKSTSGFLGKDPLSHNPLSKASLSREETIMLDQLKQVPEFRGTSKPATSYAYSRKSQTASRPVHGRSRYNSHIREIMDYVLSKDYSREDMDTPPSHLYNSEESD